MRFSQENTLKIIQHSALFDTKDESSGERKSVLQNVHCCLKLLLWKDHSDDFQSIVNSVSSLLGEQNQFPIILDVDFLKDNFASITNCNSPKSLDVGFITEDDSLIFTEFKFKKMSFNEIFKTLPEKIRDTHMIFNPLIENGTYHIDNQTYVLYNDSNIESVKDIYKRKLAEMDTDDQNAPNIYKQCMPMSVSEWLQKFF